MCSCSATVETFQADSGEDYRHNVKVTICIPMGGSLVSHRIVRSGRTQRTPRTNHTASRVIPHQLREWDDHVSRACTYQRFRVGISCMYTIIRARRIGLTKRQTITRTALSLVIGFEFWKTEKQMERARTLCRAPRKIPFCNSVIFKLVNRHVKI